MTKKSRSSRLRGRTVEKPLPAPIPDTPANLARALLSTPPKGEDEWDYLKDRSLPASTLLRTEPRKGKQKDDA